MRDRYANLRRIQRLDPARDYRMITHLDACYEFPWDSARALEFALYRTYCVPSISALLDQTGEFAQRAQRRYDDTALLIAEFANSGSDDERGRAALRQMNRIHHQYAIANDDYLYVLSTFVFEPIRWNARFGWRRLCANERLAAFYHWREIGQRMGIQRIPETYEAFEAFNITFERERFHYAASNARVGAATRDLFMSWFPPLLRPLVRLGIYALLDEPVRAAFGFPRAPALVRALGERALRARAWALRAFPPRETPYLYVEQRHRSYPQGYTISDLGPPGFVAATRARQMDAEE
ncbi:MAG TPA: oxygenase MpaB family protein [Ktedonobacterales bacterium]|nr:oxygenase MpaB family protein [Ktedonobacterales bacterium]